MAAIILRAGCRLGLAGRREAAGGAPDLTLTRAPLQQAVRMNFDARMAARWFGRLNRRRESRIVTLETSYFAEDVRMPNFFLVCRTLGL
ncbi:hypothetical protein [Extensimonas perlucida]|jgi:hypothetical protein|uniref:hypothetical protein n=1 Tax=Extensimonas perlucida TaxID=2590786 RepID=UPI0011A1D866|nr:hypothetical protein [Extensimonas perlucida]MBC7216515.1 hypothetical protein [Burkholderiaceae bacterium]